MMSKTKKEEVLFQQLQSHGYDVILPRFFVDTGRQGRLQSKPYFPGYLFIRLDLSKESVSTLQWMPNSEGLVSFESNPAYVPDVLVEAILRHTKQLNQISKTEGREDFHNRTPGDEQAKLPASYNSIFMPGLTGVQRVQTFLNMLEGVSLSQSGRKNTL